MFRFVPSDAHQTIKSAFPSDPGGGRVSAPTLGGSGCAGAVFPTNIKNWMTCVDQFRVRRGPPLALGGHHAAHSGHQLPPQQVLHVVHRVAVPLAHLLPAGYCGRATAGLEAALCRVSFAWGGAAKQDDDVGCQPQCSSFTRNNTKPLHKHWLGVLREGFARDQPCFGQSGTTGGENGGKEVGRTPCMQKY